MASRRYHEIDLLRAMACAMVVVFHYLYRGQQDGWVPFHLDAWLTSIAKFGYLGVDLFFVISGFVIFLSAQKGGARAFLASRVARLYPAYWVAIAATVVVVRSGALPGLVVPWHDVLINCTMFTHWFGASYVDGAYWSLAVELQFYIMVWLVLRFDALAYTPVLMLAWLFLSIVDLLHPIYPLELFFIVQWAPHFCVGICSFLIQRQGARPLLVGIFLLSSLLVVLGVCKAAWKSNAVDHFDAWVAFVFISMVVVVFWLISKNRIRVSAHPALYWAGALTYPVYLLHEYIGYVGLTQLYAWGVSPYLSLLFVVFFILCFSYLVHVFIEKRYSSLIRKGIAGG